MSTDRELLEAAARAYWGDEIDDVCSIRWLELDQAIGYTHGDNQDHNGDDRERVWNPLHDDGDALRLAVKLHIGIEYDDHVIDAFGDYEYPGYKAHARIKDAEFDADPYAATRRAIVRAAAAIGA